MASSLFSGDIPRKESMTDQASNFYDEVPYPSGAHAETHPDRLATIATLFGIRPPPVEHCHVLELGCGEGTNIIAMACALPHSTFLGIDSATRPIVEGHQAITELGLRNVRLERGDIADFSPEVGPFDYIIAHGVYSWVPAAVRDRLLAICHANLSTNGVAYVSYNTYPGCHLREMTREMMLFHTRGLCNVADTIAQGRALVKFLAASKNQPDLYRMLLYKELERAVKCGDAAFYHDDLSPVFHPVYLHEFVAHAAEHGLQFLGDAVFKDMQPDDYTPGVLATLKELESDVVMREQYLDFLMCRRFRRTLLCHREVALDHKVRSQAIAGFLAAADVQPTSSVPEIQSLVVEEFRTRDGASIKTNLPLNKAALIHLGKCWPRPVHFAELMAGARRLAVSGQTQDPEERDAAALCDMLLCAYAAGAVELHVWAPRLVTEVSNRPLAFPIARVQSRRGKQVPTLRHTAAELGDETSRELLGLLDGTRDFNALVNSLAGSIEAGKAHIRRDGKQVTEPAQVRAIIADELPRTLQQLARSGLLIG